MDCGKLRFLICPYFSVILTKPYVFKDDASKPYVGSPVPVKEIKEKYRTGKKRGKYNKKQEEIKRRSNIAKIKKEMR